MSEEQNHPGRESASRPFFIQLDVFIASGVGEEQASAVPQRPRRRAALMEAPPLLLNVGVTPWGRWWGEGCWGGLTPDICQRLCQCIRTTSTAATRLWWVGGKVIGQGGCRDKLLLGVCVCEAEQTVSPAAALQPLTPMLCLCRALRSLLAAGACPPEVPGFTSLSREWSARLGKGQQPSQRLYRTSNLFSPFLERRLFLLSHVPLSSSDDCLHLTAQSASQQGELLV